MPIGCIKWFSDEKGFGFIEQDNGEDVFVHYPAIQMDGFRSVTEGQEVEFEIQSSDRGLRAANVRPV